MILRALALALPFLYLGATALWSPITTWWLGFDSADYLNVAACGSCLPDMPSLAFCRPPIYPTLLSVLGDKDILWLNALSASLAVWAMTRFALRRGFSEGVASWTGLVTSVALLPVVPMVLSDAVCCALLFAAVLVAFDGDTEDSAIGAGLLVACAALTRQAATVWILTIPAAMLVLRGRQAIDRSIIALGLALIPVMLWSSHVYVRTGVFNVTTYGISTQLHPGMSAQILTGGDPARAPIETRRLLAEEREWMKRDTLRYLEFDFVGKGTTVAERRAYEWERFSETLRAHPDGLAHYLLKAPFYVALSSPRQWEAQFPGLIPRSVVRVVSPALFVLFVAGLWILGKRDRRLLYALLVLAVPVFAQALLIGPTVTARTLLPALPLTALSVALGASWVLRRFCPHRWRTLSAPTPDNDFTERIECLRCGATATSYPTENPHRVVFDECATRPTT